ncbi:MAG TPA: hypothetical protein VG759_26630 [Candidatus Angelobacter sp.]|jgi:hypothetical protein|nr:hypothetical protein [Candidatus Angelobacter sp.]
MFPSNSFIATNIGSVAVAELADPAIGKPVAVEQPEKCFTIKTATGKVFRCGRTARIVLYGGGYVFAWESLGCTIMTQNGAEDVISVAEADQPVKVWTLALASAPHIATIDNICFICD